MGLPAMDANGIYRIDTIPPPDGEDSAYDAPTKVGELARATVHDMFAAAIETEKVASEPPPPMSGARPKAAIAVSAPAVVAAPPAVAAKLPSFADEADESTFEPTMHSPVEAQPQLPVLTPTYLPLTGYQDIFTPAPTPRFGIVHAAAIAAAIGIVGLIASFVI